LVFLTVGDLLVNS